jgi:hypothetical protein
MLPQEVFLSHSSHDHVFVEALVKALQRHGVPAWYCTNNILGAQQWHDEIGTALRRCDWFVVVLSPAALASVWVKREVLFAMNDLRFEQRLLPILYQPCAPEQLSWALPLLQFVDFTGNFHEGCRRLLRVWGLGYQPANEPPPGELG